MSFARSTAPPAYNSVRAAPESPYKSYQRRAPAVEREYATLPVACIDEVASPSRTFLHHVRSGAATPMPQHATRRENPRPRTGKNVHKDLLKKVLGAVYIPYDITSKTIAADSNSYRHNPYTAVRLLPDSNAQMVIKCFPIEALADPRRALEMIQTIFNAVIRSEETLEGLVITVCRIETDQNFSTQFTVFVNTNAEDLRPFFAFVNNRIVTDRHGFYLVANTAEATAALWNYCGPIGAMKQHIRHYQMDGLPWNRFAVGFRFNHVARTYEPFPNSHQDSRSVSICGASDSD